MVFYTKYQYITSFFCLTLFLSPSPFLSLFIREIFTFPMRNHPNSDMPSNIFILNGIFSFFFLFALPIIFIFFFVTLFFSSILNLILMFLSDCFCHLNTFTYSQKFCYHLCMAKLHKYVLEYNGIYCKVKSIL